MTVRKVMWHKHESTIGMPIQGLQRSFIFRPRASCDHNLGSRCGPPCPCLRKVPRSGEDAFHSRIAVHGDVLLKPDSIEGLSCGLVLHTNCRKQLPQCGRRWLGPNNSTRWGRKGMTRNAVGRTRQEVGPQIVFGQGHREFCSYQRRHVSGMSSGRTATRSSSRQSDIK